MHTIPGSNTFLSHMVECRNTQCHGEQQCTKAQHQCCYMKCRETCMNEAINDTYNKALYNFYSNLTVTWVASKIL